MVLNMTDSQATNKAIIERWYAAINRGDLDYADTIFGPGFAGGAGSAPVKRFLARLRTGIPDFALTIEDCFAAGEKVAVRGTLRGTHTGPYRHEAATGKPVAVSRLEIFEFAEGQIVQVWANHDELSLLEQLGAGLPDPDITTPIRRYFEEVHNERQFAVMDEIFGADWQLRRLQKVHYHGPSCFSGYAFHYFGPDCGRRQSRSALDIAGSSPKYDEK